MATMAATVEYVAVDDAEWVQLKARVAALTPQAGVTVTVGEDTAKTVTVTETREVDVSEEPRP